MTNNTIPRAFESEKVLLSSCLADGPGCYTKAINGGISAASFTDVALQLIWQTIGEMIASGAHVEESTVFLQLQNKGRMDKVGMQNFLAVSGQAATSLYVEPAIRYVRNAEVRRKVQAEAVALQELCSRSSEDDPAPEISICAQRILSLGAGLQSDQDAPWNEIVKRSEVMLEEIIAADEGNQKGAIRWPWAVMNALFAPMQKGQLVIVAARPSVGKSSLARPIALQAAGDGEQVYFVTLEVNPERVPLQMAASIARLGLREASRAHHADQNGLRVALRSLLDLGITISKRDRSIARICGRARALKAQGKIDLLIIDHGLYLDEVFRAKASEQIAAISQVTKALKTLAQEIDIVVVLLWQLNRASANDDNREPNLSDMRGSGSLEEDADKVIFIHRPNAAPGTGMLQSASSTAEECPNFMQNIIQAKGRDDGTSIFTMKFNRATATFSPVQG